MRDLPYQQTSDPIRQGPSLFKIVGKPAGKADGYRYSAGFAKADFVWDDTKLDAYLANPRRWSQAPTWPTASPRRRPAPPSSPI